VLAVKLPHLHHIHGAPIDYVGLALAAFASWVGVPGPGEPVLVAGAIFASKHKLDIGAVLAVAFAAAMLGGVAGWVLGRATGRRIVTARGPFHAARLKALRRGELVFKRWPVIAVVMTPSWVAGINHAHASVFLPVNAVGAAAWTAGIGLGAYFAGPVVLDIFSDLGAAAGIGVGIVIVAAGAGELLRRRRHRLET
jgi:membrane protein DedA with SNARE-associated domain